MFQYKADGRNTNWIEDIKTQFNENNPCAIVFCTNCGYIIGVAK